MEFQEEVEVDDNNHPISLPILYPETVVGWLTSLARIEPFFKELSGQRFQKQLRNDKIARAITSHIAIEGETVRERSVLKRISSKTDKKVRPDVEHLIDVYRLVDTLAERKQPFSEENLTELHLAIAEDPYSFDHDAVIYLSEWIKKTMHINPYMQAFSTMAYGHFLQVYTEKETLSLRILSDALLKLREVEIADYVDFNQVMNEHHDEYLEKIASLEGTDDLWSFIEFAAEMFYEAAEKTRQEISGRQRHSPELRPEKRRQKISYLARALGEITISDVVNLLPGIPRRTLERDLNTLVGSEELVALGEKKARKYKSAA